MLGDCESLSNNGKEAGAFAKDVDIGHCPLANAGIVFRKAVLNGTTLDNGYFIFSPPLNSLSSLPIQLRRQ